MGKRADRITAGRAVARLGVGAGWGRRGRAWVQWVRLHLMASRAVEVTATVHRVDRFCFYGAPNRTIYTVWFSWTDPAGVPQLRERQYAFFGQRPWDFEKLTAAGSLILIRHPRGRSRRFIAEIPYTPTMADQVV